VERKRVRSVSHIVRGKEQEKEEGEYVEAACAFAMTNERGRSVET